MSNWAEPSRPNSLMRLSDFILGDKIYVPISTLHRLNIEPDSISYIERSETSNQPRWAPLRPQCVGRERPLGHLPLWRVATWHEWNFVLMNEERALFVMRLSIKKNKLMSERSQWWLDLCAVRSVHVCICVHLNVHVYNGKWGHLEQCWTFGLYNSWGTDMLACTETCVSI